MLEILEKVGELELTSAENAALDRLKRSKDFEILMNILARWVMKRAYDLTSTRHDEQNVDLIELQGSHQLLKKIAKLIDEVLPPPVKSKE